MLSRTCPVKVVARQGGPSYRVAHELVTFKALAADTNGAYSLFETVTDPGQGAPPHRQRFDDEAFWVLEGSYTFQLDAEQVILGPGGYAYVPRGMVHGYTNSGAQPARMLVLVTPGGIHERFFVEIGARITDPRIDTRPIELLALPQLQQIAQKYGIEILSGE